VSDDLEIQPHNPRMISFINL